MTLPKDFTDLLPSKLAEQHHEEGPVYYLWVFDPHEDKIILEHNYGKHRAEHVDHAKLAERVPHPDRVHGYAYKIVGGFRITDYEHRPVEDPHVLKKVKDALVGAKNPAVENSQVQARAQR
jgi:hypothetical protein